MDGGSDAWFDRELAGCSFADERLNKRLRKLVAQMGSAMGESIPLVCQDWANTKAAYRFLSNDRVSEAAAPQAAAHNVGMISQHALVEHARGVGAAARTDLHVIRAGREGRVVAAGGDLSSLATRITR